MSTWEEAPQWLEHIVIDGVQLLLALRLANAPAADTVDATVTAWLIAFMARGHWVEERDGPRFKAAFLRLVSTLDRWPAPKHLLDAMPAAAAQISLPPPSGKPMPADVRAKLHALATLMRSPHQKGVQR